MREDFTINSGLYGKKIKIKNQGISQPCDYKPVLYLGGQYRISNAI